MNIYNIVGNKKHSATAYEADAKDVKKYFDLK